MQHDWQEFLSRYLLTALAGCLVLGVAPPVVKVGRVRSAIARVAQLAEAGALAEALGTAKAFEAWSWPYPVLNERLNTHAIRCLVRLGELDVAEQRARASLSGRRPSGVSASGFWGVIQAPANAILNGLLVRETSAGGVNGRSPFDVLVDEMAAAGENKRADAFSDEVLAVEQQEVFGKIMTAAPPPPHSGGVSAPAEPRTPPAIMPSPGFPKWAVVTSQFARAYSRTGRFLRVIEPATVVAVQRVADTRAGELAVCRHEHDPQLQDPFVIRTRDVETYPGPLDDAQPELVELAVKRARLSMEIHNKRRDLVSAFDKDNPHAREYLNLKEQFKQQWKRSKDLQARRDGAEGVERIRYSDELRKMKDESVQLAKAYEDAKEKYHRWQARHPVPAGNPEIDTLENELESVSRQIRAVRAPD